MTEERVQLLREAIADHLELNGPRDWNLVRAQFPDVSHAAFWRHVKAVREPPPVHDAKPTEPAPLLASADGLFPPFFEPLKKLAEFERLIPEAEEMGRQARNAQGKIINWKMHAKSIEMRRTLLQEQIHAAQVLLKLGRLKRFYEEIVAVIGEVSPEVRKEIMARTLAVVDRYPDID